MNPKQSKPAAPRDISELKAKLGLTKPGAEPAAPPPPVAGPILTPTSQPVVPTLLGVPEPTAPPPPILPGAAPLPVAPPADPRRDPFAAVQARAAAIDPFVDAGPPVALPEQKKPLLPKILLAVGVVVTFGVGYVWGNIYYAKKMVNKTIDDAALIKAEVEGLRKKSQVVFDAVNESTKRLKNANRRPGFPDPELIAALEKLLPLEPPKTDKIFRTNYAFLDNVTIDRLFSYYNDTVRLYAEVKDFVEKGRDGGAWREDLQKVIAQAEAEAAEGGKGNFGVILENRGGIAVGWLVQVQSPICGGDPTVTDCEPAQISGFKVKAGPNATPGSFKVKGADHERVIPISPTDGYAPTVLSGGVEQIAYRSYVARLTEIIKLSQVLVDAERDLLKELGAAAGRKKEFTF